MKGGAVMEAISPLKVATDYVKVQSVTAIFIGHASPEQGCGLKVARERHLKHTLRNEVQEPLFCGATPAPSSLDDDIFADSGDESL